MIDSMKNEWALGFMSFVSLDARPQHDNTQTNEKKKINPKKKTVDRPTWVTEIGTKPWENDDDDNDSRGN